MRDNSYVYALYRAFYSRPFYRGLAGQGKGAGLLYLLFLAALAFLPEMANLHAELAGLIEREAPRFVEQMPKITIRGGHASIAEEVPYMIYDQERKTPVVIIDTSGKTQSLEGTGALVLVTRTQITVQREGSGPRTFDFADFGDMVIDRKNVYEWLDIMNSLFAVLMYPFGVLFGFLSGLLQVFICATVGLPMAQRFGLSLDMKTRMRLAAAALTPAVTLQAAHAVLGIPFPYRMAVSLVITLGYMLYALSSVADTSEAR
ncbi:MAG: hypothetical protein OHK006_09950 [Thermodesulfovibrionales bacterium]